MTETTGAAPLTLAERAALRLQQDILAGHMVPGEKLGVVDLAARLGMGSTPVREGLSRLVAQGLVTAVGRRGFRVSEVNPADLADLTRLRCLIEAEGLRLSLAQGDDLWEAGIIAALHRLKVQVRRRGLQAGGDTPEYDSLHKGFHMALIAASGSPRLLEQASLLYDQAYRYRRLMLKELTDPEQFIRIHEALAEGVLSRDPDRATALLRGHLETTLSYVYPGAAQNPKDALL